jgi:sodium/proline symporter
MIWKVVGVVVYLAVLVLIGVVASRRMKDVRDYYAAGKKLNFWAVAFSARATGESGWLLLGLTGMGAMVGVRAFWVVLGEVLGVGLAWLLMSRRFHRLTMKYDAITIPDYLEARFGDTSHKLRLVAAGALTIFVTIYVAAQIYATGQAFSDFLDWNFYVGIAVGFAVVMAYSISGGFLAVVWSDVFQGTLMFLGLVGLPIVGVAVAGGPGEVAAGLEAIDPSLLTLAGAEGWTLETIFATLSLALIGLGFLGSPQIFVRFLSLRDEKEIPQGTAVAILWTLLADSGAVLTGIVGRVLLTDPGTDVEAALGTGAEGVLPTLVGEVLPAVLVGLFIAIVLAAIMSTIDSLLVVASSAAVRDVYQQVLHPEMHDDELVSRSRVTTFALALIAVAIALIATGPGQTVFWFVIFGWSGIAATFCPTVILSLGWRGFTGRGALAAMIVGFFSVPLFKFGAPELPVVGVYFDALGELPPAFGMSFLAGLMFSLGDERGRRAADVSF